MKIGQKTQDLDAFVSAILSEKIRVGDVIKQSELCDVLEMSLSPLRELLVILEELEFVEVKPRVGFKIIYPDIEFMRENMQFRVMIEQHAIETFIETVDNDWIDEQVELHNQVIDQLNSHAGVAEANASVLGIDREFHRSIVASLNNSAISKAHEYTQTKLGIARKVHRRIPPQKSNMNAMKDHLVILENLKDRDLKETLRKLDSHFTGSIRHTLVGY